MKTCPSCLWIAAGVTVVVILARYFPRIGGLVLLSLVLLLLYRATQAGVFGRA